MRWGLLTLALGLDPRLTSIPDAGTTLFRGSKTAASDMCLFFDGGCAFAEETCGGLLNTMDHTQPCGAFMYRVHDAYQQCELSLDHAGFRTEGFVTCFYEHIPTPSCESVCLGLPDEKCGVRCRQFKVCAMECRDSDRQFTLDHCFSSCFSGAVFHPIQTCAGRCGEHAADATCYCDEPCLYEDDCCPDFDVACYGGDVKPPTSFLSHRGRDSTRAIRRAASSEGKRLTGTGVLPSPA